MGTVTIPSTRAWLSRREAADLLGFSVDSIDRRIAAGLLPAYRSGPKTIRVRREDVEHLLVRIPVGGAA
ncbi:MAG: helix-turn-helix domain-containing protein [Propionibacterium sp.]